MEEIKLDENILERKNKGWCQNNEITSSIVMQTCEHVKVCLINVNYISLLLIKTSTTSA